MATLSPLVPAQPVQSLEQTIDAAAAEAGQIVAAFSPTAATAIEAGAEVEPIISGIVHMFIGLFKHHAKQAVKQPAQPSGQPSPAQPGS